ncbi:MAG TPA: hypothetical protein VIV12_08660 [Streptosporangiaceae bacterium]
MSEPTAEECSEHRPFEVDGETGIACWYPQMGGYVGKAVAVPVGGCVDVYVWHDGEFPFGDDTPPVVLHHCDGAQFVQFGEFLQSIQQDGTT